MKGKKLLILLLAFLAACVPVQRGIVQGPVRIVPAVTGAEATLPVKVVTLLPQGSLTPALPEAATPTAPKPTYTSPVLRPTSTPFALSDLHIKIVTYRDEQTGFAIDYPADWTRSPVSADEPINGPVHTVTLLSSPPAAQPKDPDVLSPGTTKVTVSVYKDKLRSYDQAIADRQEQLQASDSPAKVLRQEEWALPGSLKATYFRLETAGGQVDELVTVIQQQMVVVAGYGELTLFRSLARTLRELH